MNPSQHINQTSGRVEYFTPPSIVDAARRTMRTIDLDPASCAEANERYVRAKHFYTEADDGLSQPWFGKVWMNHPFSKEGNRKWIDRLVRAWTTGEIEEACCIVYACTSESWFQPLFGFPLCFLSPRTNYFLPGGGVLKGVPKGSVVAYMGYSRSNFVDTFCGMGQIVWPHRPTERHIPKRL